jgi:two-component system cell cycle response regulator
MARILIVEDNPENLELMRYLLQAFGHEPLVAADGLAGLAAARRDAPDLILCDIHMPGLDGHGVLAGLRRDPRLARIPVLAVTALAMIGDRGKLLAAGFDGYIGKPIEPEKFVAEVESFLGVLSQRREAAPPEWRNSLPAALPVAKFASVLVVDDSPINRELIQHTLSAFGYAITLADNVADALALARSAPPALIISDLHMPQRDGFEFLRTVKGDARLAAIPFIFLSSSVWGDKDSVKAIELGAQRFLQRPIEPQALLREVRAILPPPQA